MSDYYTKLCTKLDKIYVKQFMKVVNRLCKSIRKPKYSNEYYLYHIILVLADLQKWESLSTVCSNKSKYHYKTIQDKHLQWSKLNIYETTYRILLKKYTHNKLNKNNNLVLFIDSALIYNKNGNELIGYGQNPKKRETKISAICDEDKNIHSIIITEVNQKTLTKTTLMSDQLSIEHNIKNLLETKLKFKKLYLVGDKGYARNMKAKQHLKTKYKTELIYPHLKNQKSKTPANSKKLLKKRYVIENVFAKLKRYDRICMRKDKLVSTYKGFIFLASIMLFKK